MVGDQSSTRPAPAKRASKRKTEKTGKVAAKYRDPDNKRRTWSGRGSMPRWLTEKVKRCQSAVDFLIPGLARPTPTIPRWVNDLCSSSASECDLGPIARPWPTRAHRLVSVE
nr:H-NS histone family protein [Luteimonas sp. 100069]